jgi:hypothetical protein
MGEMNFLKPVLNNGDMGRDCEVEEWCHRPAYQLSSSDRLLNIPIVSDGQAVYERTIRYKCANEHRFDKTFTIKKDLLRRN